MKYHKTEETKTKKHNAYCDHFGPDQSDNIHPMIKITDDFYLVI